MEGRLLFESALRSESEISVVIFDIDHFKKINDEFGHDTGDIILKRISDTCQSEIRIIDLLIRFGGEEFIIILPGTSSEDASSAAERIRIRLENSVYPEIGRSVTVSGGIYSGIPDKTRKLGYFIENADKALYKSKQTGRNRISTDTEDM